MDQQQQQQHLSPAIPPNANTTPYALPINDDNAPDLYIPFMSLITYVLLCALCYGTAGQFDPEVILNVTTKCIIIQFMEVCLFKFGVYMIIGGSSGSTSTLGKDGNTTTLSFMDLFSFTGYKYLALTCNMLIGLSVTLMRIGSSSSSATIDGGVDMSGDGDGSSASAASASKIAAAAASAAANAATNSNGYGGQRGYYIMFFWTASSISYFIFKTMTNNIPYTYEHQHGTSTGPKREFVILGLAASQFFTMWFLGQTKYLN